MHVPCTSHAQAMHQPCASHAQAMHSNAKFMQTYALLCKIMLQPCRTNAQSIVNRCKKQRKTMHMPLSHALPCHLIDFNPT
eukprot:6136800-Lingulodinium_polyedra.AAC.1